MDEPCPVCGDRHPDTEPHTLGTLTIGVRP